MGTQVLRATQLWFYALPNNRAPCSARLSERPGRNEKLWRKAPSFVALKFLFGSGRRSREAGEIR